MEFSLAIQIISIVVFCTKLMTLFMSIFYGLNFCANLAAKKEVKFDILIFSLASTLFVAMQWLR